LIALIVAVSVVLIVAPSAGAESGGSAGGGSWFRYPLLVTQIPSESGLTRRNAEAAGTLRRRYGDGARVLVLDGPSSARLLAPGFQSAADPDVSFDGKRILFAGKRTAADRWNVFEATIQSGAIRQITKGLGDCRSPSYQGSMYIITENEPWHQVTFVHTEEGTLNEYGDSSATAVYSCKLDGTFVQRLTYNLSSDYDPVVMPDGRLVFAAWRRGTWDYGLAGRITLMGVNTDGIDPAPFCGQVGRRIKHMPCVTAGGLVVFVEADQVPWDGSGMLACVSLRRPLGSYRPLTGAPEGLFHSPWGLPDGSILVSRRPADGSGVHAVYRMDLATRRLEKVFEDPRYHTIQARLLAPRSEPDGRSSALVPEEPLGKFYCLDVYQTDFRDRTWMPRGTVKRLRILEGMPRRAVEEKRSGGVQERGIGERRERQGVSSTPPLLHSSTIIPVPQLAQRRILGDVPVAGDGSFNVEVPANVPIQLQLVDDKGMALRSCEWIWTRNHVSQGCIGCHEDPELTPTNWLVDALTTDSLRAAPPPGQRESLGFRRDVLPLVAKKCAACHGKGGSPPLVDPGTGGGGQGAGDAARQVYETLLARDAQADPHTLRWKYVDPGRARTSPLVWHVLGTNTSRPWDGPAASRPAKPIPPGPSEPLSAAEKAMLIRWIDLGAAWEAVAAGDRATPAPDRGRR
jgi:hypothetical protein